MPLNLVNSMDILAVWYIKQEIETERFRAAQSLVQITFITAGLGLRFKDTTLVRFSRSK